jgi:transcriptional regulator with XRE-family HTH domain
MSQADLADRIGTSRRWVTMIETGRGSGAELGKIMAALSALGLRLTVDDALPELSPLEQELSDLLGGGDL